jgi:serine protease SohB
MIDLLLQYLLFLAKTATLSIAILTVVIGILAFSAKQKQALKKGKLEITNLSEQIKETQDEIKQAIYSKKYLKNLIKQESKDKKDQKTKKATQINEEQKPKLFVLEFIGDIKASAVTSLQQCINAILPLINKTDEILIKLESSGGMVHTYGLAASQLDRIKNHGIKLNIAIDKVAASGGYMMACVADRVIAAPFAIIGSIGVIGQIPNFNKFLEKHDIEFEQHTAGEFKRTLTIFGKNDDKARAKFHEELQETHNLFKNYITERRAIVNINEVATGEHWYGQTALDKKLVDEIATSDDILLNYYKTHELFEVKYEHKKSLGEKLSNSAQMTIDSFFKILQGKINNI